MVIICNCELFIISYIYYSFDRERPKGADFIYYGMLLPNLSSVF
jgi:hypothetical protein